MLYIMSSGYPKPNLILGIPASFNPTDFPQSSNCDCSDGYIQSIYSPTTATSIYYNSTDTIPVYLNNSITIPAGNWQISYNLTINLYSNYTAIVFLSTSSSPSTAIANRVANSQTCFRTNNISTTTTDFRTASSTFVKSLPTTATYYLYGVCTIAGVPANTPIFSNSLTGLTSDPDCSIVLSALYIP